jgi:hypothetical protein
MTTLRLGSDDNPQLTHLMKTLQRDDQSRARRMASVVLIIAALIGVTACSHAMMMMHGTGGKRPSSCVTFGPADSQGSMRPHCSISKRVDERVGPGAVSDRSTQNIWPIEK